MDFFGWVSRGWFGYTELSMAPVCLLLTLYRGESYTYTGDLSTEELTLSIEGHGDAFVPVTQTPQSDAHLVYSR